MTIITETPVRLFASPRTWIEDEAVRQLHAAARLEGVRFVAGFPDLHLGKGSPVGAAFVTEGMIHPSLVGGDIGCGMALFKTDLPRHKAKLDCWAELPFDLEHPWEGDTRERLTSEGLLTTQFAEAFGTLGGGNHFAELQAVEKVDDSKAFNSLGLGRSELVLLVHSGSRGVGRSVLETHIEEHGAGGMEASSHAATRYMLCHDHAVRWAEANRALVAERFLAALGSRGQRVFDACHNTITPVPTPTPLRRVRGAGGFGAGREQASRWLHRKGAAPADHGPLVIAGTHGSFSYLVQPLGDGQSHAWSLAHGAGRKYPRSEARARVRERFRPEQLLQTGLGGRVICGDRNLLYEEAPPAYKDVGQVIADLVEDRLIAVIATLRPLLTYKTRGLE